RPPDAARRVSAPVATARHRPAPVPTPTTRPGGRRALLPRPALVLIACALGFLALVRRRPPATAPGVARQAAPIIPSDALLPDNADLLRELDPAHRARVHDDRSRHHR